MYEALLLQNDNKRSEKESESPITVYDYLFDYHLERYSILQQLFLLNLCAIDVVIYPC